MRSSIPSTKVELFSELVRSKFPLPNFKIGGAMSITPAGCEIAGSVSLLELFYNSIYKESRYDFKSTEACIHFTTLDSGLSILKSKTFLLTAFKQMVDKKEVSHLHDRLKDFDITDSASERLKKTMYCLSMCKSIVEEEGESKYLWNNYGDHGKGVGLVLSFDYQFSHHWVNHFLSEIRYGEDGIPEIEDFGREYRRFVLEQGLSISNMSSLFRVVFGFHKQGSYKAEKEVRLLVCGDKYEHGINYKPKKEVAIEFTPRYKSEDFDLLPPQEVLDHIFPVITVEKVILGPNLTQLEVSTATGAISELTKDYGVRPKIIQSKVNVGK